MGVLPDVAGIDKEFDYWVPPRLDSAVRPGSVVRVQLAGRRVGGWVTAERSEAPAGVSLKPISALRGWGPDEDLLELASWAAWRWAGRRQSILDTASPKTATKTLPVPASTPPGAPSPQALDASVVAALEEACALSCEGGQAGPVVLRIPPAQDPTPIVAYLAQRGATLVVVPSSVRAATLVARLRSAGGDVASLPSEWAQARAGAAVVVGARAAAWAPCPGLRVAVVVDGHSEALAQEQAPTWNAFEVLAERARRAGIPCVVTSACPSVEMLARSRLVRVSRSAERAGWAAIEVVDRRKDDPRLGLYSKPLVALARGGGKVVCVLNRTGRARMLACRACGEICRCERCGAALREEAPGAKGQPSPIRGLGCPRCGEVRPLICARCGSSALRNLAIGVSRVREELEALAGRPVGEVTAACVQVPDTQVLVGTEALLHRVPRCDAVAFVDFDQELLARRARAGEQALALLALGSRLVGGRRRGGRVLVQTRLPAHEAILAALGADPSILTEVERSLRASLHLPPAAAMAIVSGQQAGEYCAAVLALDPAVEVSGPDQGRYLLRAPDHATLCSTLAHLRRPPGRLRVEVDPVRF